MTKDKNIFMRFTFHPLAAVRTLVSLSVLALCADFSGSASAAETNLPIATNLPSQETISAKVSAANAITNIGRETNIFLRTNSLLLTNSTATTLTNANASSTNSSSTSRLDFTSFKVVSDRNIFNPNRSSRSGRTSVPEVRRQPKIEAFGLVGTLSYEKGNFAFFDGTSSQFKKVVKPGEAINGYTVTDIAANSVKMKTADKELDFPIGMQMRREDEGEWKLVAKSESFASAPSATNASASSDTNGSAPKAESSPAGDTGDLLERLRKKREAELNK